MNKVLVVRRALLALGALLAVLLAVAIAQTSLIVAVLTALLVATLASHLWLLGRSQRAEQRQRWLLRRELETRIAELETIAGLGPAHDAGAASSPAGSDSYRHAALTLGRISRIERTLGMRPAPLPDHAHPKDAS